MENKQMSTSSAEYESKQLTMQTVLLLVNRGLLLQHRGSIFFYL